MRDCAAVVIVVVSAFFGGALGNAAPSQAAANRAVARKGPIEIWLELKETHVKVGGRLRFKLGIKNAGRSLVMVPDAVFRNMEALEDSLRFKRGIFIEVVDARGGGAFAKPFPQGSDLCITVVSPSTRTPSIDDFPDSGNDPYEITRLKKLTPGEVLVTQAWELPIHKECEVRRQASTDGLADLWQFDFESPGIYRIRAVYDQAPSDRIQKASKDRPDPEEIKLQTRWIEVRAR